jgi:hypothetical protein
MDELFFPIGACSIIDQRKENGWKVDYQSDIEDDPGILTISS